MSQPRSIHKGDIVQEPFPASFYKQGFDPARGVVTEEIGRAHVVVRWPDGGHTKHHQTELRRS